MKSAPALLQHRLLALAQGHGRQGRVEKVLEFFFKKNTTWEYNARCANLVWLTCLSLSAFSSSLLAFSSDLILLSLSCNFFKEKPSEATSRS